MKPRTDSELVMELLPADGGPVLHDKVVEASGLGWPMASNALASLACDGRARVWSDRGHTWVRRVPQAEVG